jgi:hypothetical protein
MATISRCVSGKKMVKEENSMPMHTKASMERLTQGAKGTNEKTNKDGGTHHTAYTNTNRVSYDKDSSGKISNIHTSNNNNRNTHYNIVKR